MEISLKKNDGLCKLKIKGEMNIYNAAVLKDRLLGAISDCLQIELDLSDVSEMDTSGFQLLIMLKKESEQLNKTLTIITCSTKVENVLELYDMRGYFYGA